jgi:hypothetical protein
MSWFRRGSGVTSGGSILIVIACVIAACGNPPTPTPTNTVGPNGTTPDSSAAVTASDDGSSLVPYDQATAIDAAQAELDQIDQMRREAGIVALIGPAGPTVLKNVDEAKVENAAKTLPKVANLLGLDLSDSSSGIASVQGLPPPQRAGDNIEWSGSLVGQVSATATMMMTLLPTAIAELMTRSEDSRPGTPIDDSETYHPDPHDGLVETIRIRTRVRITAAAGKVVMDLDIDSVDSIREQGSNRELKRLEGHAHGHIDVNACPDPDGVSPGSYELSLKEDLIQPGSTNAGDAKNITAPFSLFDGDDAHLLRIEGNLGITEHSHGPGTAGTDPASPFDWNVSATIPEVIGARGAVTGGAPSVHSDGSATDAQVAGTVGGRRAAENYLKVLATEAEKVWRSGKCIDLKPSDETRKVQPSEKIDLTVESHGKFDGGQEIKAPIVGKFTGTASLDPKDQPVEEPARFTFTAGPNKDDKGTIDLKQTSKRGIGVRQIVFTVDVPTFQAKVDGTVLTNANGNKYDAAIHLRPTDLTQGDDGAFHAHATVSWTTTYTPPTAQCKPVTYTGTFETDITVAVDPKDPTSVVFQATFIPGVLKPETLVCSGRNFPFNGGTSLGSWATLSAPHTLVLGQPLKIPSPAAFGTALNTVTITKKPPK